MKPLLSATVKNIKELDGRYPLMASPKLDGIRALICKGEVVSRNLKTIPNEHVQQLFHHLPEGLDGELIVGGPTDEECFRNTTSGVMSLEGEPKVTFWAFDIYNRPDLTFKDRFKIVRACAKEHPHVRAVPHKTVHNGFEVAEYEEAILQRGYEGIMLRSLDGLYKEGRSTLREGYLMKLKRFEDSEAKIVGMEELNHNANTLEKDNLGHAKRSSKKEGLVPKGTMGSLVVRDIHTGVKFNIGAGFTEEQRDWFWERRVNLGLRKKIIKYKFFPSGSKDKPRFPVFIGFRDKNDL